MGVPVAIRQEQSRGVRHFGKAAAGHLEHANLVGRAEPVLGRPQEPEGVRAVALEGEDGVDHMFDDAWARDLAVLGHVPDEQQRGVARLGEADQRLRRPAHLADRSRRRFDRVAPHGLNGIDDHELRRVARAERRHDVLDERLRRELYGRLGKPKPGRAQAHLGGRFLARDVDDAAARARDGRARLDQKRRLADARLAADQRG